MGKNKENDELQSTIKTLVTKICASEDFIKNMSELFTSAIAEHLKNKVEHLEKENEKLRSQLKRQEEITKNLLIRSEKIDQAQKSKSIRIYGIKEIKNENLNKVVLGIFEKKLGLQIKQTKIEKIYRIGKMEKDKIRPVYVTFTRLDIKNNIYNNKKLLKGTGMVIREDLTKEKIKLIKLLQEKCGAADKLWTLGGIIHVKINEETSPVTIYSEEDVNRLFPDN